ncbi:MAG TPA: FAD-dependent oxidoreductase [Acidimicrobiales bacterium]|jgi:NADPH-dependent 2,4-dienoyl-CoA reductase/sulfur reductase-like enzyme|nr:FAD-dependent oxidoreductase [Acidimicrobiales bacterium]HMS89988.1 FAD-dependent oxidoreductase [Acidimicrobiales bacterium]HRA33396.1 FAD-dependent oxidoreductase [Acidimicrobiales bacterium]
MSAPLERVVVVGASLAGIRAAETLRAEGFSGDLVVVGDEPHPPYDRPPLSKEVLTAAVAPDVRLRAVTSGLDASLELGVAAVGLDLGERRVTLADGRALPFDGLVVASGCSPRALPGTDGLRRVRTLRTLDDARSVRDLLHSGARRVLVVGAGFIGAEVAASCRFLGVEVTLVEPLSQPLLRVLGARVGAVVADLHREHGVDVRLGVGVASVAERHGDRPDGSVRVELSDGSTLEVDLVVVGIGVVPRTGWLEGSGLTVDDGVVCDATTLAAPGVVAAGDVARWPNHLFDEAMRVEHWEHALDMGAHAARRLLEGDGPGTPYTPVPWFWSDQYDRKIQLAGRVRPDDELLVVAGALDEPRFCVLYGRAGRVTGALAVNMPARVVRYRRAIADRLTWADALAEVEAQDRPPG